MRQPQLACFQCEPRDHSNARLIAAMHRKAPRRSSRQAYS